MVMERASLDPAEVQSLLAPCTRLMFRPPPGRAAHTFAIKFRSQDLFHADRFHAAFPDAAYVFMYRGRRRLGAGPSGTCWRPSALRRRSPATQRRYLWWIMSAATDPGDARRHPRPGGG